MSATRRPDKEDSAKLLIELLAEVADVLSEYQERVAEEARLVTSTSTRRSLRELRRKIKILSKEVTCLKNDLDRTSRRNEKSK